MRRWGLIVTIFYAVLVTVLFVPGFVALTSKYSAAGIFRESVYLLQHSFPWICIAILTSGQGLLLFLSVDTSWRRLRPRQHVAVTALFAGFCIALLASAALWSLLAGFYGDDFGRWPLWVEATEPGLLLQGLIVFAVFWGFWGGLFYLHCKSTSDVVSALVSWLLKGSVLELLIAAPAHVVARHRNDCSAPIVTGFGIVTGIAVMLLCFGPGVLALYKKKYDAYRATSRG